VIAGQYTSSELDAAVISNLLLRATFWHAESTFQIAKQNQRQAQPITLVKQTFAQARSIYEQVLSRGTKLRSSFPEKTQNLYSITDGEKLEIPIIGESQFMISRCYYEEGDPTSAKLSLQQLKTPDTLKLKADYLMALITYDQKSFADAKSMAENWLNNEATKDMPDEFTVGMQNVVSKVELDSGNVSEAKTKALDTWALYQTINGLWEESAYIVAKCYLQQKDAEKARSWFNRLQNSTYEQWRVVGRDGIAQLAVTPDGGK
jgi:tetratricopeptide (TPR) repeat protein